MQRLDLRSAVIEAIDNARPLLDARKHRLRTAFSSDPLIVRGDSTRLVQVAQNLLNNAAKYTDQGGTIDISATREGSYAVLRVQDSGTGISPSLLPLIFDLFTQDDQALDRAQGGLGLGLTLVRRIVELHDGSVEAHSEGRGRGSTFTIKLPVLLADQAADAAPDGGSRPFAAGLLRCLVVEDNVDAAEMLKVALEWEGHAVRLAFDGEDAIVAASAFQPDVIVLDIGLPSTNGYETARAIRLLPGLQNAIIIATTGYGQDSDRHKSRDAGINYHLVKPVKIEALLGAIAAARASLSKH
jgi:CheY-like chemotaxis protein